MFDLAYGNRGGGFDCGSLLNFVHGEQRSTWAARMISGGMDSFFGGQRSCDGSCSRKESPIHFFDCVFYKTIKNSDFLLTDPRLYKTFLSFVIFRSKMQLRVPDHSQTFYTSNITPS